MSRALVYTIVSFVLAAPLLAQEPTATPEKRSWLYRMLHPFGSSNPTPNYKDARLRGLMLDIKVSPEPVKLSEIRQLQVNMNLKNLGKRAIVLEFPSEQRFEIYLRNSSEAILTIWSDNHAFEDKPGTVLINPSEHVDYPATIATRDLSPNKVFICEVFFPQFPELRVRQKFMTAP